MPEERRGAIPDHHLGGAGEELDICLVAGWQGADPRPAGLLPSQPQPTQVKCAAEFLQVLYAQSAMLHRRAHLAPINLVVPATELLLTGPGESPTSLVSFFEELDGRPEHRQRIRRHGRQDASHQHPSACNKQQTTLPSREARANPVEDELKMH